MTAAIAQLCDNQTSEAARWWNTERPLTHSSDLSREGLAMKATRQKPPCSIDGCDRPFYAKTYCRPHYDKLCQRANPRVRKTPVDVQATFRRVMAKVEKTAGCWLWTGATQPDGYGHCWNGRTQELVHRYVYKHLVGPIPQGLQLDHLCRVRNCVNPDHLEPVTPQVNTLRGIGTSAVNAEKTHCAHGHAYTPDNTELKRRSNGRAYRMCRKCKVIYQERQTAKRRASRAAAAEQDEPKREQS